MRYIYYDDSFYDIREEDYSLKTASLQASKRLAKQEQYSHYDTCCYTEIEDNIDSWADYSLSFENTHHMKFDRLSMDECVVFPKKRKLTKRGSITSFIK